MKPIQDKNIARRNRRVALLTGVTLTAVAVVLAQDKPTVVEQWPLAPVSDASIPRASEGKKELLLQIEKPIPAPPPNDPLLEFNSDAAVKGELLYAPQIQIKGVEAAQRYWVLRSLNEKKLIENQLSSVSTYHGKVYHEVWDPQFSPDGQHIIFKVGDPFLDYNSYDLYHWDFSARKLHKIPAPDPMNYRFVRWSPDSRYIGYLTGGDRNGLMDYGFAEIRLNAYDLKTGKNHVIAKNPGVARFAWTKQNTLLFTMVPSQPDAKTKAKAMTEGSAKPTPITSLRSSVYESKIGGVQPQLLIKDAYYINPSPDGQTIAFLGYEEETKEKPKKGNAPIREKPIKDGRIQTSKGLFLFDLKTKQRTRIAAEELNQLNWSPDGKALITLRETYRTVGKAGQGQAQIKAMDMATLKWRNVATLQAKDFEPSPRGEIWPQFEPVVSRDGRHLIVKVSEYTGADHPSFTTEMKILVMVDLQSGQAVPVARLLNKYGNIVGWDWHDESTPAAAPSTQP